MLRLVYVIIISLPIIIYYIWRTHYIARHIDQYSIDKRYNIIKRMINIMCHNGHIHTKVYGTDNLPKEGGYVMYSNHQGKYDALGIIKAHKKSCTFLIDETRSKLPFANEFSILLEASRIDKSDIKNQLFTIKNIINEVKNGRRYIIFPEGGYAPETHNNIQDFLPGAFKCSIRSKTPIVPVAIIDSYKVFGVNSLRKVTTQVHFLEPINYSEYKEMNTSEIADTVKRRISKVITDCA